MINEASAILGEGIALRSSDIDLVEIHGYGFPRWRGGLMHYAETLGLDKVVQALDDLASQDLADSPCAFLRAAAGVSESHDMPQ